MSFWWRRSLGVWYEVIGPVGLGTILIGTTAGILVGAIPGLTGATLIALTLPLTFSAEPQTAMMLLVSMYVGAISGGMISSTLLRMPGTPASIMTTLDGYPMAKQGRPGRALGLGISSSLVGGLIAGCFLVLLARPISLMSAKMGPFEYFSLVLMALVLIASLGGGSLLRSLLAGILGILAAMPGISTATGEVRLTFGLVELNDGFKLLPVLIGLFAVNQVMRDIAQPETKMEAIGLSRKGMFLTIADWRQQAVNLLRSSIIGTWIGILPGIGANIGSVTAYSVAKNLSRNPSQFGTGCDSGIVAAESANNATVGGALIPLVAMGLPGSVIDAILLGGLIVHGLQPGPRMFQENPEMVYTIMGTYLIANLMMALVMFVSVGLLARLASVPRAYLLPIILAFCVVGSYSLSSRMFDVWVMIAFGVIGLAMERLKIPLAPFVIGFVLGPIAEENLSAGLMSSNGSYLPIVTQPISAFFFFVALALFIYPMIRQAWRIRSNTADQVP